MLTKRSAGTASAFRSLAPVGAAIVLSAVTLTYAGAAGIGGLSCVGGAGSVNCALQWGATGDYHLRTVPAPLGEAERSVAAARDHRWQDYCHPVIERDGYGVARYRYAAPGCEYGIGADEEAPP